MIKTHKECYERYKEMLNTFSDMELVQLHIGCVKEGDEEFRRAILIEMGNRAKSKEANDES